MLGYLIEAGLFVGACYLGEKVTKGKPQQLFNSVNRSISGVFSVTSNLVSDVADALEEAGKKEADITRKAK